MHRATPQWRRAVSEYESARNKLSRPSSVGLRGTGANINHARISDVRSEISFRMNWCRFTRRRYRIFRPYVVSRIYRDSRIFHFRLNLLAVIRTIVPRYTRDVFVEFPQRRTRGSGMSINVLTTINILRRIGLINVKTSIRNKWHSNGIRSLREVNSRGTRSEFRPPIIKLADATTLRQFHSRTKRITENELSREIIQFSAHRTIEIYRNLLLSDCNEYAGIDMRNKTRGKRHVTSSGLEIAVREHEEGTGEYMNCVSPTCRTIKLSCNVYIYDTRALIADT